jgi:hypothetical protein
MTWLFATIAPEITLQTKRFLDFPISFLWNSFFRGMYVQEDGGCATTSPPSSLSVLFDFRLASQ